MRLSLLPALALLAATAAPVQAQTAISLGLRLGGNLATRSGDDPDYTLSNGYGSSSANAGKTLDYTRSSLLAPQFGAVLNVSFGKLALQPAILFSQKGADQHLKATTTTLAAGGSSFYSSTVTEEYFLVSRPNYLEIPINLVYTTGGDHGFQIFAGPYVAFGMGGQTKLEVQSTSNSNSSGGSGLYYGYSYGTTFFTYRDDYPGSPASAASTKAPDFLATSGAIVARRFDAGVNAGIGYRFGPLQVQAGYGWGIINQQPSRAPGQNADLTPYYQRVGQLTATYLFKVK